MVLLEPICVEGYSDKDPAATAGAEDLARVLNLVGFRPRILFEAQVHELFPTIRIGLHYCDIRFVVFSLLVCIWDLNESADLDRQSVWGERSPVLLLPFLHFHLLLVILPLARSIITVIIGIIIVVVGEQTRLTGPASA
jgi:hypothetical protein